MKIANKNYNLQPQKTYSKFDNESNGEHTGILFNNTERSTNSSSNFLYRVTSAYQSCSLQLMETGEQISVVRESAICL